MIVFLLPIEKASIIDWFRLDLVGKTVYNQLLTTTTETGNNINIQGILTFSLSLFLNLAMANDFEIWKGSKYGTYTLKQKINL